MRSKHLVWLFTLAALVGWAAPARQMKAVSRSQAPTVAIAAAGDIACDPADPAFNRGAGTAGACHMKQTSDLLVGRHLAAVLALGDLQYSCAAPADFAASFDPTWGRVKRLIHPAPGNHEYLPYPDASGVDDCPRNGSGYFDYFGGAAGPRNAGYYSFDIARWHLIALNSECGVVGGCEAGSPEERWLREDLARHRALCTIAFWHRPYLTSSETTHRYEAFRAFWDDLQAFGVEVVLNGHFHNYERFAPQDDLGGVDRRRGIREFIVGTGGDYLSPFNGRLRASRVRNDHTFGVLVLTLRPRSYIWRFVPEAGAHFSDAGSSACHR
jgi:hypothetical protein